MRWGERTRENNNKGQIMFYGLEVRILDFILFVMGNYWQILTLIVGRVVIGSDVSSGKRTWSSLGKQDWKLGDR